MDPLYPKKFSRILSGSEKTSPKPKSWNRHSSRWKKLLRFAGVKDESCPAELVRRRWIARCVPVHWNPQQFLEILQTKGWRTIDEIQPPNHKGGLWCFKATPPPGCGEACEMSVGSGKSVVFSPWFPKRPQPPKTVPLKIYIQRMGC